jgi:hypothetical protein
MADGTFTFNDRTTDPAPPSSGKVKIYQKGMVLYQIDALGVVRALGSLPTHATTHENGGSDEINVAGLSGLLADGQTPLGHNASHEHGGSDEIEIADMGTSETDTTKRLAPDGLGGVAWGDAPTVDMRNILIADHFVSGNLSSDSFGSAGWRLLSAGTGADQTTTPEVGHPGVLDSGLGTVVAGRSGLYLGESGIGNFLLGSTQGQIDMEWLVKFNANALSALSMTRWTLGFGDSFGAGSLVEHANGVYVDFEPGASANFRLRTAAASVRSTAGSGIAVASTTWYRIVIRMTYPGGVPTVALLINGTVVATLTTNIPSAAVGVGSRGDCGIVTAAEARFQVDYCLATQVTNKET